MSNYQTALILILIGLANLAISVSVWPFVRQHVKSALAKIFVQTAPIHVMRHVVAISKRVDGARKMVCQEDPYDSVYLTLVVTFGIHVFINASPSRDELIIYCDERFLDFAKALRWYLHKEKNLDFRITSMSSHLYKVPEG